MKDTARYIVCHSFIGVYKIQLGMPILSLKVNLWSIQDTARMPILSSKINLSGIQDTAKYAILSYPSLQVNLVDI